MLQVAEREAAAKRAEQLEQERQQAVEAVKAAEQEKAALNKLRDMLVVRAEGSAVVAAAGPGLTTSGKVSVPAQIEVSAEVRNVLAGEAGPVIGGAADVADATVSFQCLLLFSSLHHSRSLRTECLQMDLEDQQVFHLCVPS